MNNGVTVSAKTINGSIPKGNVMTVNVKCSLVPKFFEYENVVDSFIVKQKESSESPELREKLEYFKKNL